MEDSNETGATKNKVLPIKTTRPPLSKKRRKHKPSDFPKRPLSAYNIFFKETREQLLSTKPKAGESGEGADDDTSDFQSMVKEIASRWKVLGKEERERCEILAKEDLQRYKDEVKAYEDQMVIRSRKEREEAQRQKQKESEEADLGRSAAVPNRTRAENELPTAISGENALDSHGNNDVEEGFNDLDKLLADEIRAMELVHTCKVHQIRLARQLQALNPESQILLSLNARRWSLGLPPLLAAGEMRGDTASTIGASFGGGGALGSMSLEGNLNEQKTEVGAGFLPPASSNNPYITQAEEEAALRNYSMRLHEEELRSFRLQNMHQQNSLLTDLAARQTTSLLDANAAGISSADLLRSSGTQYDAATFSQLGGLSGLRR